MPHRSGRAGWKVVTASGAVLAAQFGCTVPSGAQAIPVAVPAAVTVEPAPPVTPDGIVRMSSWQLEQLYRAAPPGRVPHGPVRGIPIVAPGRSVGPAASRAGRLVWQGKDFDGGGGTAVNRFFGIKAVRGRLYQGTSWLDGRPSLVLDYQDTSLVYRRYRDEIREVAPGLYLGAMFSRTQPQPTFTRYFAFEAR
jgi:hypothetical protein